MNIEQTPWRAVPTGARVLDPAGTPWEVGPWLSPTVRVVGPHPRTVDPDASVRMVVPALPDVAMMFLRAGFTIEGMQACPPDG